jgi:uncharacterized UBP type Zn finger protein
MIVNNNECVRMVKASDNIIDSTLKGYIFCCEVDPNSLIVNYYNVPVLIRDGIKGELKSYPRIFTITPKMTIKDFRENIYGFMRRYIDLPLKLNEAVNSKYEKLIEKANSNSEISYEEYHNIIKEEYEAFFLNSNDSNIDDNTRNEFINSLPYCLYLLNPKDNSRIEIFNSELIASELINNKLENLSLNNKHEKRDEFSNSNDSLKSVIELVKSGFKIVLEIINDNLINPDKIKLLQTCVSIATKEKTKPLNLNDCLEHFRLTERLEKNNEWYCKDCKKHQQAYKKLELFFTPKLLILHLKRFEYSSMGRYRTWAEKIDFNIDFPIDNLDLSSHTIGPDSTKAIYDLYAVSQHYGSTGGGHYTAVAKNFDKWYGFNDSSVSPINENSIVSSASYLLFYRRKDS